MKLLILLCNAERGTAGTFNGCGPAMPPDAPLVASGRFQSTAASEIQCVVRSPPLPSGYESRRQEKAIGDTSDFVFGDEPRGGKGVHHAYLNRCPGGPPEGVAVCDALESAIQGAIRIETAPGRAPCALLALDAD